MKPETLLVLRDGLIDDEYYEVVYQRKRQEALHAIPTAIFSNLIKSGNVIYHKVLDSMLSEE